MAGANARDNQAGPPSAGVEPIPVLEPPISTRVAASLYVVATIALTWPLVSGLARHIPGDFGDPLFTSWVLAWDATHLGRGLWSANIFAPHPLALAYSEHFLPQAVQVLPIYALTSNPILCYNLVFLSTFVLSALGMFLFARELTGSPYAAFAAGLAFAFSPYRIASIPHLQVLSAAWMPFVLYGFRRHFRTRRVRPLAGATAAWILQNLSCGYYLFFFSPIVLAYIAWELVRSRAWRDRATTMRLVAAVLVMTAVTVPFLLPYAALRARGFLPRSIEETRRFSADVYAYFTADPNLRVWGPIAQAWPRAEGLLFPGLTILTLAGLGAVRRSSGDGAMERRRSTRDRGTTSAEDGGRGAIDAGSGTRTALLVAIAAWIALLASLLLGYAIRLPGLKIASVPRVLAGGAVLASISIAVSARVRATIAAWLRAPSGFFAIVVLFAVAMSFGPDIHARGRRVVAANVYTLFYEYVPGFDGLRVPARYAAVVTLGLATLTALGIASVTASRRRIVAVAASVLIAIEAAAVPIPIDQNSTDYSQSNLKPLPATVGVGAETPPVYAFVARLPADATLLELPAGEPAFDIRYMFYSTRHWRRLVNGYSGGAPESYGYLTEALKDALIRPERAWQAVAGSGATHLIVHEGFYQGDFGRRLADWAQAHGAVEVAVIGSDRVFSVGRDGYRF